MGYVCFDLETTVKTLNKRKASPFHPENFVVAAGWKRQGDAKVSGTYFGTKPKPFDWFTRLLEGTSLLVGFNIKFDILHAIREPQNYDAWMEYVARGGNIWDCQCAEYLLQGMQPSSHMLAMDEAVTSYGGNLKIDEVKALWNAGVETTDIDPDLLMRYLCGDESGLGDIGNTEVIFLGQLAKARKTGQVKSILLNMGSLICTTEMEFRGMFVNKELGLRLASELQARLETITAELRSYLPEGLPFEFNWSNRYHLSPLIFGGKVKYEKRVTTTDEQGNPAYYQKDAEVVYLKHEKTTNADGKVEHKTMPLEDWRRMDHQPEPLRYGSGKNAGELKTKKVKVPDLSRGPKSAMREFFYEFKGHTEPKQEWASSTEGLYSVAGEVIEALGNRDIPFLKTLAEVAGLTKDLTTYYISLDEKTGEHKGMLTLVGGDSIIHHSINHTSTVTARFSSSNPNLQNVPKEGKSHVKSVFESRFGKMEIIESDYDPVTQTTRTVRRGGQIVQSDFTALEVYVQANLTLCKQLIEDLRAGLDMHCVRVSQKEGITYEDALLKCKGDKSRGIAPLPEWEKKRTEAKVFSFQRAYGAGAAKIAESTGMKQEDVEALIKAENERYPELAAYNAAKTKRIELSRRPTQNIQPHPDIPGLMCQLGKGWSVTPDNKVYSYRESPAPKWSIQRGGMPQSFSPTEIANYEVQGAGGEWAKAAMWLAVRAFYARKNFGGRALLTNNVHDAVYADIHADVLDEAAGLLHACMLHASTFIEQWFGWKVAVPVPSVTVHGDSMIEENNFGEAFDKHADTFYEVIRKDYLGGYRAGFEATAAH
jgi:DNA polymerase I-like protein with 3'-5' exonuclease and polymerase domains